MNLIKKTSTGVLICLLLYGCGFFASAGKKVSQYCPGLNLKINGVSISISGGREITAVDYSDSYQQKVDTYFTDKTHGFTGGGRNKYEGLKANDETLVADGDSILSKTIDADTAKKTATVIYNVSTRKIIIVEDKKGE